jgi:hypothetical protein
VLTPNVPPAALHDLIDRVQARVLEDHPLLRLMMQTGELEVQG